MKRGPYKQWKLTGQPPPLRTARRMRQTNSSLDAENNRSSPPLDDRVSDWDSDSSSGSDSEGESFTQGSQLPEFGSQSLFEGSSRTLSEGLVLLLQFSLHHKLSTGALENLLKILAHLLPEGNLMTSNIDHFKNFFSGFRQIPIYHYYCGRCQQVLASADAICDICREKVSSSQVKYFIELPLEPQIRRLFGIHEFYNGLMYPKNRVKKNPGSYEDFLDGYLYTRFATFFSVPQHLSCSWNTDGISVFASSNYSLWPIYIKFNSLPPNLRDKYVLILGLWFGYEKPQFNTFLELLPRNFNPFYEQGFRVESPAGTPLIARGLLQTDVMDLPASAATKYMVGHVGYHGCLDCETPGYQVANPYGKGNKMKLAFPHRGPCPLRTKEAVVRLSEEAFQTGNKKKGIYGPSVLSTVVGYDYIGGTIIDYMHDIAGIGKEMLSLWTDGKYRKEPWYFGNRLDFVDSILLSIKVPTYLTRRPRSISSHLKYWKASEIRAWILYYSVPILLSFLPQAYYWHWCCFVLGLWLLLQDSISPTQLQLADGLLLTFYQEMSALYGDCYCTMNIHNVSHWRHNVEKAGPLWANSCFLFEAENGKLDEQILGTNNVIFMMLERLTMKQALRSLNLRVSKETSGLLKAMGLSFERVSHKTGFLGKPMSIALSQRETSFFLQHGLRVTILSAYARYRKGKFTLTSPQYKRMTRQSNSTIAYHQGGRMCYGDIHFFFMLHDVPCALVDAFRLTNEVPELKELAPLYGFICPYFPAANQLALVPVTEIIGPCTTIREGTVRHFVMRLVNHQELRF